MTTLHQQKKKNKTELELKIKNIHSKGQYFTTNINLLEKLISFILNNPTNILEPSIGQGDIVNYILKNKNDIKFDMYEIDTTISLLNGIEEKYVIYGDFLEKDITKKYKTIVGNPPYIKNKSSKTSSCENTYIKFIEKCFKLLEDKGELIFIVPSDFIKLTSSSKLIINMMNEGTFTHIYHPNDENLFKYASIDVIIFRYCKDNTLSNKIMVNDKEKYINNSNGILTFVDTAPDTTKQIKYIKDYFDVYVGLVSGKEEFFKIIDKNPPPLQKKEFKNIEVLNKKNCIDNYICIELRSLNNGTHYPTDNEELNKYIEANKEKLKERKIKKFNDNNWYEWGALRNHTVMKKKEGKSCIYISTITRNKEVSFIDKVRYFGGGLIMLLPKNDKQITSEKLKKVNNYLNSDTFKSNYMYSGRFKIGHKQICNSVIEI